MADLVVQEPVPELGVVTLSIEQGIGPVRPLILDRRGGMLQPPVVELVSDLQHPARNRDRRPSTASSLTSG